MIADKELTRSCYQTVTCHAAAGKAQHIGSLGISPFNLPPPPETLVLMDINLWREVKHKRPSVLCLSFLTYSKVLVEKNILSFLLVLGFKTEFKYEI